MPRTALIILATWLSSAPLTAQSVDRPQEPATASSVEVSGNAEPTGAPDAKFVRRGGADAKSGQMAAQQSNSQSSWRGTAALAAVVALILLLAWGYRTAVGKAAFPLSRGTAGSTGVLQIISRMTIAPRHSLCLVRVGGRMVLIGVSADRLATLDVIADGDSVAKLAGQAVAARSESRSSEFRQALDDENALIESDADPLGEMGDDRSVGRLRDQLASTLQRLRTNSGVRS
ncbi:MAG: flagellar biosynthetic protein FliO [Phycisphaerales bacterium]|nr:flagellar biosynthetic protein FliO [Phycisphaerales bacterium]